MEEETRHEKQDYYLAQIALEAHRPWSKKKDLTIQTFLLKNENAPKTVTAARTPGRKLTIKSALQWLGIKP